MRHNEAILPADKNEFVQDFSDKAELAYRQNLADVLPLVPTELLVSRANDSDYEPTTDPRSSSYSKSMADAASLLSKAWGGDAETGQAGPVDIYVLSKLQAFNSVQMKASRGLARNSGRAGGVSEGISAQADSYVAEFRRSIEPATQEMIKDELLRRVNEAADDAHYGYEEKEESLLSALQRYQSSDGDKAVPASETILEMYKSALKQERRNQPKQAFLARAFAVFAKDDPRGYGSEQLPVQTIKYNTILKQLTDEVNKIAASLHFATKPKLESAVMDSASKYEPLFLALGRSAPDLTIIEQRPKSAEVAEKVRVVGKQSVDAAKVAGKVSLRAAAPTGLAVSIGIQGMAAPAARASTMPSVKPEIVATQMVNFEMKAKAPKKTFDQKQLLRSYDNLMAQAKNDGNMSRYRALHIMRFLSSKGMNQHCAVSLAPVCEAGFIGNFDVESAGSFSPTQKQIGGGPGRSFAQWEQSRNGGSGRYDQLVRFAKKRGLRVDALETHEEFVWHELQNGFRHVKGKLDGTKTVAEAAEIVVRYYEIPANWRASINQRTQRGEKYFNMVVGEYNRLSKAADGAPAPKPAPKPAPTPKPDAKPAPTPPAVDKNVPDGEKFLPIDDKIFEGLGGGGSTVREGAQGGGGAAIELLPPSNQPPVNESGERPDSFAPKINVAELIGSVIISSSEGRPSSETVGQEPGSDTGPDASDGSYLVIDQAPFIEAPDPSVAPPVTEAPIGQTPSSPSVTPPSASIPSEDAAPGGTQQSPGVDLGSLIDTTGIVAQPAPEKADPTSPDSTTSSQDSQASPTTTPAPDLPPVLELEPIIDVTPEQPAPSASEAVTDPDITTIDIGSDQAAKEGEIAIAQPDPEAPAPTPEAPTRPPESTPPAASDPGKADPAPKKPDDNKEDKPTPKQEKPKPQEKNSVQIIKGPVTSAGKGLPVAPEVMKKYGVGTKFLGYTNDRPGHHHDGADIPVPVGTPVLAIDDGVVMHAGKYRNSSKSGILNVIVRFNDGTWGNYQHVSKFKVKEGQKVNRGQVIALSGNTGYPNYSTGPHLHVTIAAAHDTDGYVGVDSPRVLQDAVNPQKVWPTMGQTESWLKKRR